MSKKLSEAQWRILNKDSELAGETLLSKVPKLTIFFNTSSSTPAPEAVTVCDLPVPSTSFQGPGKEIPVVPTNIKDTSDNQEEDEDDEDELSVHDNSDDVETHVWIPEVEPSGFEELDKDPDPNDLVLVQFNAKKEIVFYVGKVVQTENLINEIEVNFLRKARKYTGHFVFPNAPDISMVSTEDMKMTLPPPTLRLQSYYKFEINFGSLNMR
ncbi:hypothetical protein RN001_009157 [Aquatica leii]|uniref:Uncharacterized protein n=1 Tax=Aquatica leii TaxID=1421715 RepID=A0AAN7P894_9COLE|nr:hypothetical protein RN001_009157 [Aquatica leii]